jgi:hypothetical protein
VLAAAMTAAAVAAVVSRSEAVTSYPWPPTQGRTCGVTVLPNAACLSLSAGAFRWWRSRRRWWRQ